MIFIVEGITNISRSCKERNVINVTISSLICRLQKHLQNKANVVNALLLHCWKVNGSGGIDNSNISVGYLAQDGLNLNEESENSLTNDFIIFLNTVELI